MHTLRTASFFALISAVFGGACFAAAKLPTVNMNAPVMSARDLFGTPPNQIVADALPPETLGPIDPKFAAKKPTPIKSATVNKKVVARSAKTNPISVSVNDVLRPMRPEDDLWAKATQPANNKAQIARVAAPTNTISVDTDLDALIAAAQKRAGNGSVPTAQPVNINPAPVVAVRSVPAPSVAERVEPQTFIENRAPVVARAATKTPAIKIADSAPTLRREIVPMDDDQPTITNDMIARAAIDDDSNVLTSSRPHALTPLRPNDSDLTAMNPMQLKRAFQKTYISENKHLSALNIDDPFDSASDMGNDSQIVGFTSQKNLSESGGIRPLEVKIMFSGDDSALSRDNYNLLSEYAGIVAADPKRAIQISISKDATQSYDGRKLAAKRLAIVDQVLQDSGVADARIIPVLSDRDDDSFVLQIISSDTYQTLVNTRKNMFGDTTATSTQRSMSW